MDELKTGLKKHVTYRNETTEKLEKPLLPALDSRSIASNSRMNKQRKSVYRDIMDFLLEVDTRFHRGDLFEFKKRNYIITTSVLSFILSIICLSVVAGLQASNIHLFRHNKTVKIEAARSLCKTIYFSNFNIISHPIAAMLIIFYMFIFWRRTCCVKYCWGRPAFPNIVHPFKKRDRLMTACVYAIIAYEIMNIVKDAILDRHANYIYAKMVPDPTGLFRLLMRCIEMLTAAMRYYPPMIAFSANSILVYGTSSLYMLVDIGNNIYVEGQCNSFYKYNKNETIADFTIFGTFKVFETIIRGIPHFFFLSLVTVTLCYKAIEGLILMITDADERKKPLINEDLIFFSKYDIKYCHKTLNPKYTYFEEDRTDLGDRAVRLSGGRFRMPVSRAKGKLKTYFEKYVYKWHPHFKFSSRILSAHLVGFLALYYFFMEWTFNGIYQISQLAETSINLLDVLLRPLLGLFVEHDFSIPWGKVLFIHSKHVTVGFVLSALGSFLFCNLQMLLGLRSIKYDLLRIYKGDYQNVPKLESNRKILAGNTKFAGFIVGYLINGFVFIFAFFFFGFILFHTFSMHMPISVNMMYFIKFLPIIIILLTEKLLEVFVAKIIFLQKHGKLLALTYSRGYSLFVYTSFFFDCFIGTISALIRLMIGLAGSMLFMPRIGYSFLGRQLESFDGAYGVAAGYYQMEAMQSHPVLITFCAILYYKRLVGKIESINAYDLNKIVVKKGLKKAKNAATSNLTKQNSSISASGYNRRVVNRWAVAVTLINNLQLVAYRKECSSYRRVRV